jgi:hypothetical protein
MQHLNRLRRQWTAALTAIGLLAATLISGPAAAAITPDRDTAAVAAYLRAHPGGVRIGDRDIAYGGGTFIVTVSRAPGVQALDSPDCPSGWFCFYDGVDFTYPRGRLSSCGWQDLGTWGWRNRTESAHYNLSAGTVGFLNEAGTTDTVLFTVGASNRTLANVGTAANKADYVSRTGC